jgi:protein-S-isoprenylcysteine O-methyltransferase Ste14
MPSRNSLCGNSRNYQIVATALTGAIGITLKSLIDRVMKEKNGEHPFGDAGQLILLAIFLSIWGGDTFFLRKSFFLSDYIPLYFRLSILAITIAIALYLFRSGHVAVSHHQRPDKVLTDGAFRYVKHPLYLASILTYCGLTVSSFTFLPRIHSRGSYFLRLHCRL